jgi:hypothetical protein
MDFIPPIMSDAYLNSQLFSPSTSVSLLNLSTLSSEHVKEEMKNSDTTNHKDGSNEGKKGNPDLFSACDRNFF